jgi:cysteine desulfuration protein SufE
MTIQEVQEQIIEDFSAYDEWLDKYEYLIELGKNLTPFAEELKTDERLIKGCQSRVWLDAKLQDGKIVFSADSDAIITKGIISMLISVYSGRSAEEILSSDDTFIDRIGLRENLSPTRQNGLLSMLDTIRSLAKQEGLK